MRRIPSHHRILLALVLGASALGASASIAAEPAPSARDVGNATIRAIAEDRSSLAISDGTGVLHLTVDKEFRGRLGDFRPADRVNVSVEGAPSPRLTRIEAAATFRVSRLERVGILLGALVALVGIGAVALGTNVHALLVGKDGRYSNSKVQMALWFTLLIVTYVAAVWLRARQSSLTLLGGVNLPQNLLLLSGMSALTFAAAKGITVKNVEDAQRAGQPGKLDAGAPGASGRSLIANLATDDRGHPDIGDFQMLVVTLLAVAVYAIQAFKFLGGMECLRVVTLPDVDTTILTTFGVGQGAYLTKKYAGKDGA